MDVDPHWFKADPDTDPEPAFFLIADPDPVPMRIRIRIQFQIQGSDDYKLKNNNSCRYFMYLFDQKLQFIDP